MQHVGVDIIEINRIEESVRRFGQAFLERIYTQKEMDCYKDKLPSLAARFAGKEAVIKALDAPGISPRDIEILSAPDGKPLVTLYGQAKEKAAKLGIKGLDISLSHSREYAVAFVVGQSQD
ncbi:MAG: holo-[acyl-carrier-protein] synthase [Dehalococcoidia bacterium]|nr:MAG: holo-[acyl-carrier-protein] synthase [Dehalococcoidia bacterium]